MPPPRAARAALLASAVLAAAPGLQRLAPWPRALVAAPLRAPQAALGCPGGAGAARPRERGAPARRALSVEMEVRQQLLDAEAPGEASVAVCGDVGAEPSPSGRGAFLLDTDRGKCFVKCGTGGSSAPRETLEYEAEGLRRLRAATEAMRVPEPWMVGELGPGRAFIAQELLDLRGKPDADALGRGLAQLHAAPPPEDWRSFGFPMDGCCGACPQLNNEAGRDMDWVEFWREYRLGDQLRMLRERNPADTEVQELGAELMEMLPELFEPIGGGAKVQPSLLHGDLWSGNIAALKDGMPVIIDPACYYGHYEADHGINYMFGGGSAFNNRGYQREFEQAPGYPRRAVLYELHHHMNHYNIFGSGYRGSTIGKMRALLR
ncbi:unnamed protein product [Prorocentrum cordatum]|uniref:protein-ribulosamine 3-kinase n=1 Tax=Prorocentrum cordatum TaxID=2364126 RepID=A0ABN9PX19_9DINO|nr:unnamed protein product [Polarella glacialis]